ncbi:hypothetical protein [[Flexibacter] sp. ATCC 35208]|uniref:hypothetical protein n=1 Tax=[Flexibacter] sp. ATCC 35208 TaxID=1936242 RepID=UPI0009C5704A|nr:hypothetical protein [[Flexibacter] sp. ATCC 35208]OMP76701.1 hypothetical protein BW716_23820 [[Flexibacter] sp. ATCC 35208]
MRYFLTLIISIAAALSVQAQDTVAIAKAINIFRRVQAKSQQQPVSFEVNYTYSNESTPGTLLDSLKGKIEISGENYRSTLDNTETIRNAKYSIVLFKEDKLMYLAANSKSASPADPLETLNTLLKGATNSTFRTEKRNTIINVSFPAGGNCKQLSITIDTVSQRLLSMQYILKTTLLMGEEMKNEVPEGYEEYAQVKASFYNYKDIPVNSSRFDEKAFFYKDGDAFKVTPEYEDYNIFVGTPGL